MAQLKIVSGGQTGVDRAALDAARELGLDWGGWVPAGRRAEDGPIAAAYDRLVETETNDYVVRTKLNVRDSDGTLIFHDGELEGGTALTGEFARELGKPYLVVNLDGAQDGAVLRAIRTWIADESIAALNVAGPRASKRPAIYDRVRALLVELLR